MEMPSDGSVASPRRENSSRTSSGSWLSGVAVTTSTPNAPSRNSTSTTRLAGSTRSSWPASTPIRPPACDQPDRGRRAGATGAAGRSRSSPIAVQPTSSRPRRSGCGCWRSRCTAQQTSSTGTVTAALPSMVRSKPAISRPSAPAAVNQTADAEIRPAPSTASPAPSRRWAGSSSRAVAALRPTARARVPAISPSADQIRPSSRASTASGARCPRERRRAGLERPAGPPAREDAGLLAGACRVLVPLVAATCPR